MVLCSGVSSVVPPEFPPHLPGRHVVVLLASNNDPTQSDNKINVQKNFISSLFEVYLDHQCWLVDPRFGIHTKVSMVSKKLSDLVTKYLTGEKIKFNKICLRNSIRFILLEWTSEANFSTSLMANFWSIGKWVTLHFNCSKNIAYVIGKYTESSLRSLLIIELFFSAGVTIKSLQCVFDTYWTSKCHFPNFCQLYGLRQLLFESHFVRLFLN